MTENEIRAEAVLQAERWLGCRESDGSHLKILEVYNRGRPAGSYEMRAEDPWCAAFVSAVGMAAGLGDILYPSCACGEMLRRYQAAGRFEENDEAVPRPGDVIFYDWGDPGEGDCLGEPDHVGLVESVENGRLSVIEGNLSDRVARRSIRVGARFIRGYGKPDYLSRADYTPQGGTALCHPERSEAESKDLSDNASDPSTASPVGAIHESPASTSAPPADAAQDTEDLSLRTSPQTGVAIRSSPVPLPYLARGAKGETVRAAQLLLIGRGYRCGPWGADGDFGPATYGGVYSFQRGRQLEADGVIGPLTWRALLGL